jgi:hypothetical protein
LKTFSTQEEAFAFIRESRDELVSAWDGVKEFDNVKETDVRREDNQPRAGKDHREGKDATPDMFLDKFGFRGVEFGNWVSQGKNIRERQGMLNAAYDAFMVLSDVLGVPPKALSLNGELGLGMGSRGSGSASAHYEPYAVVINLTKTRLNDPHLWMLGTNDNPGESWRLYLPRRSTSIERLLLVTFTLLTPRAPTITSTRGIRGSMTVATVSPG